MADENLDQQFKDLIASVGSSSPVSGVTDTRATTGIGLLGRAIVRLDKTSTRLAIVNICLAVVLVAIGAIQIALMFKGH